MQHTNTHTYLLCKYLMVRHIFENSDTWNPTYYQRQKHQDADINFHINRYISQKEKPQSNKFNYITLFHFLPSGEKVILVYACNAKVLRSGMESEKIISGSSMYMFKYLSDKKRVEQRNLTRFCRLYTFDDDFIT